MVVYGLLGGSNLLHRTDPVPDDEGPLMFSTFHSHTNPDLDEYLQARLNIPLDFDRLNAGHAADIAVVAVAGAEDFASTEHLLSLLSVLPAPQDDREFWHDLQKASGGAYLHPTNMKPMVLRAIDGDHPTNMKPMVLRAIDGDAGGLAGQIMGGIEAMTATHRQAVAELVGETLASGIGLTYNSSLIGSLWLSDVERTTWRVLLATYSRKDSAEQARRDFRDAWKNA